MGMLLALLLLWTIAFLILYPGCCSIDSDDILNMAFGLPFEANHFRYDSINNHHPASYLFLVWVICQLGQSVGFDQAGCVALVSYAHLVILALCCSFFVARLYNLSKSKLLLAFSFVFFLSNPLIAQYSVTVWKDVIFSGFFLVFLIEYATLLLKPESLDSNKTDVISFIIAGIACTLLRNNAILPIAIALIVLAFKTSAKKAVAVSATILLPFALVVGPIYSLCDVKPGHFSEIVSVPLQQVTRTIAEDGALSNSQRAFYNEILPYDQYSKLYDPTTPNPIKFASEFNDVFLEDHKIDFMLNWFQVGCANPGIYLRAWVAQTQGFWNINYPTWYATPSGYWLDIKFESHSMLGGLMSQDDFYSIRDAFITTFSPIFNIGILTWFMLFVLAYRLREIPYDLAYCTLPLVVLWLTFLIAAPLNNFRYMLPLHLSIPLMLFLLFGAQFNPERLLRSKTGKVCPYNHKLRSKTPNNHQCSK